MISDNNGRIRTLRRLLAQWPHLLHADDKVDNEEFKQIYKLLKVTSHKKVEIEPPSPQYGERHRHRIDQWLFKLETCFGNFELPEAKKAALLQVCSPTRCSYDGNAATQMVSLLLPGTSFNERFMKYLCLQMRTFTRAQYFDALLKKALWRRTLPNFSD